MVTLTDGVMFLLFISMHFWVLEILRQTGGPVRVCADRLWSSPLISESLRNTDVYHFFNNH
jgi:hypothetical protein